MHKVKVNVYFKDHVEKIRIDVCDLGKTAVILGILWLQAHNPKINQETEEIKITRYPPLCGRNIKIKVKKEIKRRKQVRMIEKEKLVRQAVDKKENWRRKEEIEIDHRKIEEIMPREFLKWRKVFGKVKSERMLTRKIQDYAIDLKKTFKPQKERIYFLSKDKREEVQKFVTEQLKKRYI